MSVEVASPYRVVEATRDPTPVVAVEFKPGRWVWYLTKSPAEWRIGVGILHPPQVISGVAYPASVEAELYGSDTSPQVDPAALEALRWLRSNGARP